MWARQAFVVVDPDLACSYDRSSGDVNLRPCSARSIERVARSRRDARVPPALTSNDASDVKINSTLLPNEQHCISR